MSGDEARLDVGQRLAGWRLNRERKSRDGRATKQLAEGEIENAELGELGSDRRLSAFGNRHALLDGKAARRVPHAVPCRTELGNEDERAQERQQCSFDAGPGFEHGEIP